MSNERRNYPRVDVNGEANLLISGVVRSGTLLNVSPSGIQLECRHQLVERMSQYKHESGLYPDLDLEFTLPLSEDEPSRVKSSCNVSYCRRLSQDTYHLGLNFVTLSELDEKRVSDYIHHTSSAQQTLSS